MVKDKGVTLGVIKFVERDISPSRSDTVGSTGTQPSDFSGLKNVTFKLQDFPGPKPESNDFLGMENVIFKLQDFPGHKPESSDFPGL